MIMIMMSLMSVSLDSMLNKLVCEFFWPNSVHFDFFWPNSVQFESKRRLEMFAFTWISFSNTVNTDNQDGQADLGLIERRCWSDEQIHHHFRHRSNNNFLPPPKLNQSWTKIREIANARLKKVSGHIYQDDFEATQLILGNWEEWPEGCHLQTVHAVWVSRQPLFR